MGGEKNVPFFFVFGDRTLELTFIIPTFLSSPEFFFSSYATNVLIAYVEILFFFAHGILCSLLKFTESIPFFLYFVANPPKAFFTVTGSVQKMVLLSQSEGGGA